MITNRLFLFLACLVISSLRVDVRDDYNGDATQKLQGLWEMLLKKLQNLP